ncbi:MAG: 3-dehydroquinate synthase, partial [Cellvibrionales bacterium]|nr:3-dehydroquinate synthase [Cellvibrionales bacterium]
MTSDTIYLNVDLGERSYPIIIGSGLLSDAALLQQHIGDGQVLVVSNETIAPLYLDALLNNTGAKDTITLPDGEQFKQMATIETIFDRLMEKRHNRSTTLVALGGGVVGDMT